MNDSVANKTARAGVLPSADELFESCMAPPAIIALPTLGVFALACTIIFAGSINAIQGNWPMWAAMLGNGFAMYLLFSVAHDGTHRALSAIPWVNEWLARISVMMLLPIAPLEATRWLHMQHHRLTNSARDPDTFMHHGHWWAAPLRGANVDIYYLIYFARHGGPMLTRSLPPLIGYGVIFVALLAWLIWQGYGYEVLMLWFLPSRVGLALIAIVFVYLPHYPADVTAQQNVYRASTIRRGWEWLLTPLLVSQNYHLIHHLYPTLPFYRYMKVWYLKYREITAHDPAVQTAFGLQPAAPLAHSGAATPAR